MSEELKDGLVKAGFDAGWLAKFVGKFGPGSMQLLADGLASNFSAGWLMELAEKGQPIMLAIMQHLLGMQARAGALESVLPGAVNIDPSKVLTTPMGQLLIGLLQQFLPQLQLPPWQMAGVNILLAWLQTQFGAK
jgi:hypothetical protein